MPPVTRRQVLAGTSSALALLAGCAGSETRHHEVPRSDADSVEAEFVRVRSTSDPDLFWAADRQETPENERRRRVGREFLATETDVEDVEFLDKEPGDRLREFVSRTDFETASVFLYSTGVSECHEIHLTATTVRNDGDPHLDFCQSVRPADVACSKDVTHTVAYAVRFPIDGRDISGTGSGMSYRCSEPSIPPTFDTTVTVQGAGEE